MILKVVVGPRSAFGEVVFRVVFVSSCRVYFTSRRDSCLKFLKSFQKFTYMSPSFVSGVSS